jgi:hypothetical protein
MLKTTRDCRVERGERKGSYQAKEIAAAGGAEISGPHSGAASPQLLGWQRRREQEALRVVAAQGFQFFKDGSVLNALGNDFKLEQVGELDDGLDEPLIRIIAHHAHHEGFIDLEFIVPGSS